ncbi:MAG: peptide ABC transporter substrate-binding protein [Gemmatimonadaceae bacterium]|nr:peptide ABC transporter substrate-binding protein [Gemmatimonadaceae bacterium]
MRLSPLRSLVLLLAPVLAACRGDGAPAGGSDIGGTLIAVSAREPATLMPPLVSGSEGGAVVSALFDKLANLGPALETHGDSGFVPRLARTWQWAPDSLSIAFQLDSTARWHDGQPVSAADVRFTFRVYSSDSVGAEAASFLGNIDSVTTRDAHTAVFWFKRRMPQQFYDATYHMYVLPSHLLDSVPLTRLAESAFGRAPVGTGRFRFVRWDPKQRIEIASDTANYRGRAKLDRVVWTYVPDFGAATVKLFSGEADFFENILPENLPQVAQTPTLRVVNNRDLRYYFLGFNLRDPKNPAAPNPIFADLRVRRALSMAVDRQTLVRNVLDSLGEVALAPAPRALIPDTTAIKPLPYDVAAAKALLDSAGWRDSDNDGVRDKDGIPLAFEMLSPSSSGPRRKYAVLLQEQYRAIGVKATPLDLPGPEFGARTEQKKFDTYLGGWSPIPGNVGMRQTWASTGSGNDPKYVSKAFDALLDSALTTFDRTQSRVYWGRAFQQIIDDAPAVWLYEQHTPLAVHTRFVLPPLRPDGWYTDLAEWHLDPTKPRLDRDNIGLGAKR